jgi:hypothetical protein
MSEPVWPFQSLWSRAALVATGLGISGCFLASAMVFWGLFTNTPGGERAVARAPLVVGDGSWAQVFEVELEAGEKVDLWEIQEPPVEDQTSEYALVARSPSGNDQAPNRTGNSHVTVGGVRAEFRGTVVAAEAGSYQVEAQVHSLARGHSLDLAAHEPGTIGPDMRWFAALFGFGMLFSFGSLATFVELTRWFLARLQES